MSITQIVISIKDYYPLNFDFSNFVFHFVSDKIKLSDTIPYDLPKKIIHKFEVKIDNTYYIKAMIGGEIVGIANFFVPASVLYKRTKNLNISNIKFTMTDYHKKRFFLNKDKDLTIEIDIHIKFSYLSKQVTFKRKMPKKQQSELRMINTDRKRHLSPINTPGNSIHSIVNSNGLIHYKKAIEEYSTPRKYRVRSAQQSANTSFNAIPSNSDRTNEISILDSILIENEYNEGTEKDEQEKNFAQLKESVVFSSLIPKDKELVDNICLQKESFENMQKELNPKLNQLLNEQGQLVKSYSGYQDKKRELVKKINRLKQWRDKFDIKNRITVNHNRNENEYFDALIDIKNKENEILDLIFSYNKNSTKSQTKENTHKKQKNKKQNEQIINDKDLLLNTLKRMLNINMDINVCFNKEGLSKLKNICNKYQLIDVNSNNKCLYFNQQIREEEEGEQD